MGYTYEEFLREMMKQAQEEQTAYEATRRAQASSAATSVAQTYEAAKTQATAQYTAAAEAEKKAYQALFDANAVNEMVARREAAEAIADMNLGRSGLNATQQTAISLQRSRADALTREQRQQAVNTIVQELADRQAEYDRLSDEKQAALYEQAERDVQSNLATLYADARKRAQSQYEQQQQQEFEASEAQKERDHELAIAQVKATAQTASKADAAAKGEQTAEETTSLTEQLFDPEKHGTKFADLTSKPSITAIRADTQYVLRTKGNNAAWQFLEQRVNKRYITEAQWRELAEELGITQPRKPSKSEIADHVSTYILQFNRKKARDYIQQLHEDYLISVEEAYEWYDYIGLYPE